MAQRRLLRPLASRAPRSRCAYNSVKDRTRKSFKVRTLNLVNEFAQECLAIQGARRLKAVDVLSNLFFLAACRVTSAPTTTLSSSSRLYRI